MDIPHRTGGIDHEHDVLRLDRDAPELGIISASFPLNTGFAGVALFHRIETVLARLPPKMPLVNQIEILASELPQRISYLMVENILALLDQFLEQCDQRFNTDRALAST